MNSPNFALHPIQLVNISVRELYILAHHVPEKSVQLEGGQFSLSVGHSEFDLETHSISVGILLEVDAENVTDAPFDLKIELVGHFECQDEKLSENEITQWATHNAPFTLIPYLREHAFALTARCGFDPMLLPLIQVPTK